MYPNPVTNEATIEMQSAGLFENIVIMNSAGQIILKEQCNNQQKITINTADFHSGIYFVQLSGKNGISNYKIVKQ